MLEVMNLTKNYGKTMAADHVGFTVPDGKIGILLGPNGAGKSTVIKRYLCGNYSVLFYYSAPFPSNDSGWDERRFACRADNGADCGCSLEYSG